MSIMSMIPSNHLILCHPLLLLPSVFPSIRVFSNESALHIRWPKYWSFSTSPSSEYSGLISFRVDWLDLPALQGTLKSLLQHHNLKASILWRSAFFMVQLAHLYITTGKTALITLLMTLCGLLPFPSSLLLSGINYLHSPSREQVGKEAGSHSLNHAIADLHGAPAVSASHGDGPRGYRHEQ